MLPSEFRTAFRNRLLIPHPQLLAHTTCSCGKVVDPYGIHTQKCRLDGNLGAVVTQIPKAILANNWRRRISVCLQRGVANAINTRTNKLTARTLDTGSSSQGESFFPGLVEEQSEAYRDGSLIACGEEEDSWGCGTMGASGEALLVPGGRMVLKIRS